MRLHMIGGADEVGASCLLVEGGGKRIVVDCGIRVGARDPLPNLSALADVGPLDAILVTHGHLDHIGALPVLHRSFPDVPVYASPPALALAEIMLRDALKLMTSGSEREGEIPLYSEASVASLLSRMIPAVPEDPFLPCGTDGPRVTFFLAGHIIGACAVGIETTEGRILVSGDISLTNQLTVSGMAAPRFRPHLVVVESTYGDRLHANRETEEKRLVETVTDAVGAGGRVLIPAFAIGRAQEVILALIRAMRRKAIPPFPVYADGLVRNVCGVYERFPRYLTSWLRRRVEKRGDPYFGDLENVRAVASERDRAEVIAGPPCCVVASSGMLSGGASVVYAGHWAEDPRNLIAITGYQDEESPGRRLLEVADGTAAAIRIGDRDVPVRCQVRRYALSAHADANEIARLLAHLRPSDTVIVHGDPGAREGLSRMLRDERCGRLYLPVNGDHLDFAYGKAVASRPRFVRTRIGEGSMDPDAAARLADHLVSHYGPRETFSLRDLAVIWGGAQDDPSFVSAIEGCGRFTQDPRRPFLYRVLSTAEASAPEAPPDPWNPAVMLARVAEKLGPDSGLYRKGAYHEERILRLYFHFPKVATRQYAGAMNEIVEGTGWSIEVNPNPHTGVVSELIEHLLPDAVRLVKQPAVFLEREEVVATVEPMPGPEAAGSIAGSFCETTGFTLIFKEPAGFTVAKEPRAGDGALEINTAFRRIEAAFADKPHRPYRMSKKTRGDEACIELSFISPEVGARYASEIEALTLETGWEVVVARNANQFEICRRAKVVVGRIRAVLQEPAFLRAERRVRVRVDRLPSSGELEAIQGAFAEETGYGIDVVE